MDEERLRFELAQADGEAILRALDNHEAQVAQMEASESKAHLLDVLGEIRRRVTEASTS